MQSIQDTQKPYCSDSCACGLAAEFIIPFLFIIKGCVSSSYINLEITVICRDNKTVKFLCTAGFICDTLSSFVAFFVRNRQCYFMLAIFVTVQVTHHHSSASLPDALLAFSAAFPAGCQQRSLGRLVGHRWLQINRPLSIGTMGRLRGPLWPLWLADAFLPSLCSLCYLPDWGPI